MGEQIHIDHDYNYQIFQGNQKDLEMATEQLSEYLERDLRTENPQEFKENVIHVHEGYENDTRLYN